MPGKIDGVVRMGLIRRLPSLTPEQFSAHWSGPHGQFATRIPNLRRYHQNHAVRALPLSPLPDRWGLDGLSELWFDDIASMLAGIRSPDYSGLAQDTPTVMTMPGLIVGRQEFMIGSVPDEGSASKAMIMLARKAGISHDAFLADWRMRVAGLAGLPGLVAASVIAIEHWESEPAILVDYESLPVDAVVELWFDGGTSLDAAFAAPIGERLGVAGDTNTAYASAFKARTYVILG